MKPLATSDGLLKTIDTTNNKVNARCLNNSQCVIIITICRIFFGVPLRYTLVINNYMVSGIRS